MSNLIDELLSMPPAEKSAEEIELEKARDEYEKHFGEKYGIGWGFENQPTHEEEVKAIYRCINTNTRQKRATYNPNLVY
jgi:hypothetical protein